MRWTHVLSYFFGGAFLTNAVPHLVSGVTGHPFQTPFAPPTGDELSSATVNVCWGFLNLAVGYLVTLRVGQFDLRRNGHVAAFGVGVLAAALVASRVFGRFYGGL